MPNYSGKWNLQGQLAGVKQGTWTGILQSSDLYFWGNDSSGVGGLDTEDVDRSSPVQVGSESNWEYVAHGGHVTALTMSGELYSWGGNGNGQLGQGDTTGRSSPVQVGSDTDWYYIDNMSESSYAIKTNGTLWGWGDGSYGQLGNGNRTDKNSPTQIGALTNWYTVSSYGLGHILALKTDGTLWGWGRGSSGSIGDNNSIGRSSPVQVGADTDWAYISTGQYTSFAIKTDGTLWAWGTNASVLSAPLGLNDAVYRSSPTQVGALTTWSKVYASGYRAFAVKTDGTLWAWGRNTDGQLAQNDVIARSSPIQIGSDTDWNFVVAGDTVHAVKTNGTLWGWGQDSAGSLGNNDNIDRSSPIQIGSDTDWYQGSSESAERHFIRRSFSGMS